MRAYGITRVSTGKQVKFGASLEMQIERIQAMARNRGVDVIKIFTDEGVSGGETTKRVEYMKLVELVKSGQVDMIFTYHMSRYGRNFEELQRFWKICEKNNVIIEHDLDNFDYRGTFGKLMRNILGSMAEFIKDTASDTTTSTLKSLKQGGRKYCNEPYGFKTVNRVINDAGETTYAGDLVPSEPEYTHAKEIVKFHVNGRSLSWIASEYNLLGVKPKRGKQWSHSQVKSVINTFKSLTEKSSKNI